MQALDTCGLSGRHVLRVDRNVPRSPWFVSRCIIRVGTKTLARLPTTRNIFRSLLQLDDFSTKQTSTEDCVWISTNVWGPVSLKRTFVKKNEIYTCFSPVLSSMSLTINPFFVRTLRRMVLRPPRRPLTPVYGRLVGQYPLRDWVWHKHFFINQTLFWCFISCCPDQRRHHQQRAEQQLQTDTSPPEKVNVPVVLITLTVSIYSLSWSAGGLQVCHSLREFKIGMLLNGVWCKCHLVKVFFSEGVLTLVLVRISSQTLSNTKWD